MSNASRATANRLQPQVALTRPPYRLIGALAIALAAVGCEGDDDDDGVTPRDDGSVSIDGGSDSGVRSPPNEGGAQIDGGVSKEAGPDATPPETEPDADVGCRIDMECDDALVCNGPERCVSGECWPADPAKVPACNLAHPCREETKGCDCLNPNTDGDDYDDPLCVSGGEDCDDNNPAINRDGNEVCDSFGIDEDCDGTTIHDADNPRDGDADGDTFISRSCVNVDRATGVVTVGDDCDDRERTVHPNATEACDYRDNDCDTFIDEEFGKGKDFGQFVTFYQDRDGDGFGNDDVTERGCPFLEPPGYVDVGNDCNDDPTMDGVKAQPGGLELCDGIDNNCRSGKDAEDPDLLIPEEFENTVLECIGGDTVITTCPEDLMWCDTTTVSKGCETDAQRLSSCHQCETECRFACGSSGCEELAQLTVGADHTCATTSEGRAVCWGRGAYGRLGLDNTSASSIPREVEVIEEVTKVSAGPEFTCAIAGEDKVVYCWGRNEARQLGNPDGGEFSAVAIEVDGVMAETVDIAAGSQHACAVQGDSSVMCWGQTLHGRLGDGIVSDSLSDAVFALRMVTLPGNIVVRGEIDDAVAVVTGDRHTCIINLDQEVECWGANDVGQLGNDRTQLTESGFGVKVAIAEPVDQIAAGSVHTCALAGGSVYCWGSNGDGQLGRTGVAVDDEPAAVEGLDEVVSIGAGYGNTCAVTRAGALFCWGSNSYGQLGPGAPAFTAEPRRSSVTDVVEVAVSPHVCARTRSQQVYCWGDNDFGALGNGARSQQAQPVATAIKPLAGSIP